MAPTATAGRWWLYLLRCGDGTLYCGIARDVQARLAQHQAGRGAKYTRGRAPLTLVITRRCADRGMALRLEHAVKQLPRAQKDALIADRDALGRLARAVQRRRRA